MKRKLFEHKEIDLGYSDLDAETGPNGRKYFAPNGVSYPSITTVLSILSEEHIQKWRARVGEEEANKISHRASTRGTAVHLIIEKYLDNVENFDEEFMPNVVQNFKDVQPILDERIGKIYMQEAPLYSDHLGIAGRVDCIAEFDGVLSIIDFKTSRKKKKKEWITNYFIQESGYAIMFEERTGIPIVNLVTIIAVDDEEPQVFVEHRDNWAPKLLETINEYKRRKIFGR
jgi:CRISPR/Cas system-associated exonuclease Cas4 (RecB family)